MAAEQSTAFRARWVCPIEGPPLENGFVVCHGGRIVSVGRSAGGRALPAPVIDLGDCAMLPGLVNAHTHLELSDVAQPLGRPGMPLAHWIPLVVEHRRHRGELSASAVAAGRLESLRYGVTCLADIAQLAWLESLPDPAMPLGELPPDAASTNDAAASQRHDAASDNAAADRDIAAACGSLPLADAQYLPFAEWIGLSHALAAQRLAAIAQWLTRARAAGLPAGISPHAPYSVRYDALPQAVQLSRLHRVPLAMHLAESPEELQWLRDGTGPLREMLQRLGAWDASALRAGAAPADYLRLLAAAPRALVIHGNYLSDDDIALLAAHGDTLSVVFCPRTHAFFGHAPYPLQRLLAAGVRVALGTDSRASSPDLNLLAEARLVARRGLASPAQAVRMATLAGAEALGFSDRCGSLAPGKRADICAVPVRPSHRVDPYELIVESEAAASFVVVGGAVRRGPHDGSMLMSRSAGQVD
jgi:cytosine/adenosine deaminase-related metal-dependent hydrolase